MSQQIRYMCEGCRPLTSDTVKSIDLAAEIFATRIARQEFGRNGKCFAVVPVPVWPNHYNIEIGTNQDKIWMVIEVKTEPWETEISEQTSLSMSLPKFPVPKARFKTRTEAIEKAKLWASASHRPVFVFRRDGLWGRIDSHNFDRIDRSDITDIVMVQPDGSLAAGVSP